MVEHAAVNCIVIGSSTGFWPIHPSNKKSANKNQKKIENIGRNAVLLTLELFKLGNNIKTKIALIIAITPPNLSGIERNIA